MIDFSSLVLAPTISAFGKPVSITPLKSQPNAAAYSSRGVWEIETIKIMTEDGGQMSTRNIKFGVRMSEFAVWLKQGDQITTQAQYLPMGFDAGLNPTDNVDFVIDGLSADGQGGASLTLKRVIA